MRFEMKVTFELISQTLEVLLSLIFLSMSVENSRHIEWWLEFKMSLIMINGNVREWNIIWRILIWVFCGIYFVLNFIFYSNGFLQNIFFYIFFYSKGYFGQFNFVLMEKAMPFKYTKMKASFQTKCQFKAIFLNAPLSQPSIII